MSEEKLKDIIKEAFDFSETKPKEKELILDTIS